MLTEIGLRSASAAIAKLETPEGRRGSDEGVRMRILKNILIGLGSLFGLLIVFAIVTGISSARFKSEQTAFVTKYATDLSRRWELADVYDRPSNSLIEQAATPQGQQAMQQFRALGALRSVKDVDLRNYMMGSPGTTAAFALKGTFDNEKALVTVTVLKNSGAVRVQGFHADPIPGHGFSSPARAQT
jgi:hypothetical protein